MRRHIPGRKPCRIAVGSDERTVLTDTVVGELQRLGYQVTLYGALAPGQETLWPVVGQAVGEAVARGECDEGVMCCFTGTGATIATNKVPGVRAALCTDAQTAAGARRYNHANVLCLSLRLTSPEVAREILDAWFSTPPGRGEDEECVARINEMDQVLRRVPTG